MATMKTKLNQIKSIEEALDASNLNFIAQEEELMGATNGIFAPEHKMLYRPDTNDVLGVVGTKYHAIQNSTAMAFMDNIVKSKGFSYTESISKDNGAVSIITAQSEKLDAVRVGDEIAQQIQLINGFNGKVGYSVRFTTLRLVCLNGMTRNENQSVMKFKHTIRVQDRMAIALKVFDDSLEFHNQFVETAKKLSAKAVDKLMVEKFINGLYEDSKQNTKKRDTIIELFENGMGNKGESLWDLYSGATEYFNHHDSTSEEKRLESLYFGTGATKNAKAWDLAVSLL